MRLTPRPARLAVLAALALPGRQHVMGSKGNNARLSLFRYQTGLGERRTHGDTDETAHPFDRWNSNVDVG